MILVAPDRDPSDHMAPVAIAAGSLGLSVPQFFGRGKADPALLAFLSVMRGAIGTSGARPALAG